jgi:hypothetical protein
MARCATATRVGTSMGVAAASHASRGVPVSAWTSPDAAGRVFQADHELAGRERDRSDDRREVPAHGRGLTRAQHESGHRANADPEFRVSHVTVNANGPVTAEHLSFQFECN